MAHVPRIYLPGKLSPGSLVIEGEPAKRLARVMRLRAGDGFFAFAGDGHEYGATVTEVLRNSVVATIGAVTRQEAAPAVTLDLWVGLVRANRFDDAVEKCTEAGADIIRPMVSEHSARGDQASAGRQERWDRIAAEASEQCGRLHVPVITAPASLEQLLDRHGGTLLVAHPGGTSWRETARLLPASGSIAGVVGPEGGLSDDEVSRLRGQGALVTSIAPHILRTETAAAVLAALVRSATG